MMARLLRSPHWVAVLVDEEARILDASEGLVRIVGEGQPVAGEPLERFLSSPTLFADLYDPDALADVLGLSLTSRDGSLYRAEVVAVRDGGLTALVGQRVQLVHSDAVERMSLINDELTDLARELSRKSAELKRANETIRELANTDALTGVYTRRMFDEVLPRYVSLARRHVKPLSVLMLDIDHFKKVNDTHGHGRGDEVLRELGRLLTRSCRREDVACRYGGEEFLLLLPDTDVPAARLLAERLRERLATFSWTPGPSEVTCSCGVAGLQEGEVGAALVERADEALYEAKRAGRDRVVVAVADR